MENIRILSDEYKIIQECFERIIGDKNITRFGIGDMTVIIVNIKNNDLPMEIQIGKL